MRRHKWLRHRSPSGGIKLLVIAFAIGTCIAFCGTASASDGAADSADNGGTVWTWGGNIWGELGHKKGTLWPLYGGRYKPVPISKIGTATEVAAGNYHSMALDTKGSVWTWGQNEEGQLGIGMKNVSGPLSRVPNLQRVKAVAAGASCSFAVMDDGTIRAWGSNNYGQLGDGTTKDRVSPVRVEIADVKAVAAGSNFAIALKNHGTVWAWGDNSYGQLGDGTKVNRTTPVKVVNLDNVKAISCGSYMTVALKKDGTVWACGFNEYGGLGDGTNQWRSLPVQVKGLEEVAAISSGGSHVLAIRNDGTVLAWGYGYKGELGLGEDEASPRGGGPQMNIAAQIPRLQKIRAVATGWDYSLAVGPGGELWAWGRNWNGQWAVKEPRESLVPVKVPGITGIQKIACGVHHTVAIRSNPPPHQESD